MTFCYPVIYALHGAFLWGAAGWASGRGYNSSALCLVVAAVVPMRVCVPVL